jgi:hypothetical protein
MQSHAASRPPVAHAYNERLPGPPIGLIVCWLIDSSVASFALAMSAPSGHRKRREHAPGTAFGAYRAAFGAYRAAFNRGQREIRLSSSHLNCDS